MCPLLMVSVASTSRCTPAAPVTLAMMDSVAVAAPGPPMQNAAVDPSAAARPPKISRRDSWKILVISGDDHDHGDACSCDMIRIYLTGFQIHAESHSLFPAIAFPARKLINEAQNTRRSQTPTDHAPEAPFRVFTFVHRWTEFTEAQVNVGLWATERTAGWASVDLVGGADVGTPVQRLQIRAMIPTIRSSLAQRAGGGSPEAVS